MLELVRWEMTGSFRVWIGPQASSFVPQYESESGPEATPSCMASSTTHHRQAAHPSATLLSSMPGMTTSVGWRSLPQ